MAVFVLLLRASCCTVKGLPCAPSEGVAYFSTSIIKGDHPLAPPCFVTRHVGISSLLSLTLTVTSEVAAS